MRLGARKARQLGHRLRRYQPAQEPAEGSPSSAGSCVPAIGYPIPGPRCVGRGAGRRARTRRPHSPGRSAVDAVGRPKKSSVSVTPHLCSVPNVKLSAATRLVARAKYSSIVFRTSTSLTNV